MKATGWILIAIALLAAFILGVHRGKQLQEQGYDTVQEIVTTRTDTIFVAAPSVQSEQKVSTVVYKLPLAQRQEADSIPTAHQTIADVAEVADSAEVEIPLVQRHYADSTYEAWVSGPIDPRLDSIRVYAPTKEITRLQVQKPKRWHIGVTAGYGYGTKGAQPYIGVGITYSILSF